MKQEGHYLEGIRKDILDTLQAVPRTERVAFLIDLLDELVIINSLGQSQVEDKKVDPLSYYIKNYEEESKKINL